MSPDDERLLETFARAPGRLSDERRSAAERMVASDEGAAAFVKHLRSFYTLLEEEKTRETPPQVERFVGKLFDEEPSEEETGSRQIGPHEPARDRAPATTKARPFEPRRGPKPTVLAAATDTIEETSQRYRTYATLVADEGDTLVRVIGDEKSGRGRLYVLSNRPERRAWAVVSFPELGLNVATREDGTGAFTLPEETDPTDWGDVTALVRRPITTANVQPGEEMAFGDGQADERALLCHHQGHQLRATPKKTPRIAFLTVQPTGEEPDGDAPSILRLGTGSQAYPVPKSELTIRTYR